METWNEENKEEKPSIPRQSHGTRRTMYGNTERGEQGREAKHSAAEPRNEENDVWKHGTRIARCGDTEREEQGAETRNEKSKMQSLEMRRNKMAVSLVTRLCLVTEQVRLCLKNEVHKEGKHRIPRQSHGTRRARCRASK